MVSKSAPHMRTVRASSSRADVLPNLGSDLPVRESALANARGYQAVYRALSTMALARRWDLDLGRQFAGNLPARRLGKKLSAHLECPLDSISGFHCIVSMTLVRQGGRVVNHQAILSAAKDVALIRPRVHLSCWLQQLAGERC